MIKHSISWAFLKLNSKNTFKSSNLMRILQTLDQRNELKLKTKHLKRLRLYIKLLRTSSKTQLVRSCYSRQSARKPSKRSNLMKNTLLISKVCKTLIKYWKIIKIKKTKEYLKGKGLIFINRKRSETNLEISWMKFKCLKSLTINLTLTIHITNRLMMKMMTLNLYRRWVMSPAARILKVTKMMILLVSIKKKLWFCLMRMKFIWGKIQELSPRRMKLMQKNSIYMRLLLGLYIEGGIINS